MEIEKTSETYLLTNKDSNERVEVKIHIPAETFEVYRMKVNPDSGSNIVEEAEKLAVETLDKYANAKSDGQTPQKSYKG